MRLSYISSSVIPSKAANVVHVMKMCNAFIKIVDNVDLYIFIADRKFQIKEAYHIYDISENVVLRNVKCRPYRLSHILYAYLAVRDAKKRATGLVYTRSLFAAFFSKLFKIRFIYESHVPEIDSKNLLKNWIFGMTVKSAYLVKFVVITNALKTYYIAQYPKLFDKIFVAPDASDEIPKGLLPVSLRNGASSINIGYVGSLYRGKGMEMISELVKLCDWAHFHVVGGSESDVKFWKTILFAYSNITFYGHVPHNETKRYLLAFDLVLAPLQSKVSVYGGNGDIAKWTSPLKIFEYMSAGLPIIASNLEVLKEVLNDSENSILVAYDDVKEWVLAIQKLRDDVDFRNRLGQRALADFNTQYTWNQRVRGILKSSNIEIH